MRKIISSTIVQGITPTKKQLPFFKDMKLIDDMIEKYPNCKVLESSRSLTAFLIKIN